MQLGVGLRDERWGNCVDVPQPLVDDVPDRPDASPGGDEGQPTERHDGDGDPDDQPRRQRGRHRQRRDGREHTRARPALE